MASMTPLTWFALGFLIVAILGSAAFLALKALRAWRTFRSFSGTMARAIGDLAAAAEQVEARSGGLAAGLERLNDANSRLEQSLAELATLREAAGEARGLLAGVRGAVPRK